MITHCQICGREFYLVTEDMPLPLPGDPRYCQECAIKACEKMEKEIKLNETYPYGN